MKRFNFIAGKMVLPPTVFAWSKSDLLTVSREEVNRNVSINSMRNKTAELIKSSDTLIVGARC